MSDNEKMTLVMPNEDTYTGPFNICPKEVMQKGYIDKIGKNILFNGESKKVLSVKITEEKIFVELE